MNLSTSTKIYCGLIAFLILVKVIFLLFPTAFPLTEQESAFYWTTILLIASIGFVGFVLSERTGFPEIWDARISNWQRFFIPALIGVVYGIETVLRQLPNPEPIHLKLPLSIPFYAYGAIFLEIMLRLFAVTFLTWLISNVILRGRWQTGAFWIAAIVPALYEPLPHIQTELSAAPSIATPAIIIKWATEPLFIANVVSAYLYRKYGFLAPVVMRLSFYLVWHIIYGGLIAP
ncbi:MAG TPA: hypothetical protein VJU86_12500 [Pyrinomonadaceae bacterium]|nr:hypothetical protein [Pyrinomonadaceae bacterium]